MALDLGYQNIVVVFDLDDTLYEEIEFVLSGYEAVDACLSARYGLASGECFGIMRDAFRGGRNPFDELSAYLSEKRGIDDLNVSDLVSIYRFHQPHLCLRTGASGLLEELQSRGIKLGIITDGRSRTQRNKICALGLEKYFEPENVVISEEIGADKTESAGFVGFVHRYPNARGFVYVGDNPAKDFYQPNLLGWLTVCVAGGENNIHSQEAVLTLDHAPQRVIKELQQLKEII